MGVTVFVVQDSDAPDLDPGQSVHFHNGFAWFLDETFSSTGLLPASFFGQGAGTGDGPDPGPLSFGESWEFGRFISEMSDEELVALMSSNSSHPGARSDHGPAIEMIRTLGEMARTSPDGLAVR